MYEPRRSIGQLSSAEVNAVRHAHGAGPGTLQSYRSESPRAISGMACSSSSYGTATSNSTYGKFATSGDHLAAASRRLMQHRSAALASPPEAARGAGPTGRALRTGSLEIGHTGTIRAPAARHRAVSPSPAMSRSSSVGSPAVAADGVAARRSSRGLLSAADSLPAPPGYSFPGPSPRSGDSTALREPRIAAPGASQGSSTYVTARDTYRSLSSTISAETCEGPTTRDDVRRSSSDLAESSRRSLLAPGLGITGLCNLGNTCFMNSMLQCLCCVPEVLEAVLAHKDELVRQHRGPAQVAPAFIDMVLRMATMRQQDAFRPSTFLRKMSSYDSRWAGGRQQDSHEFLMSLLEALQKDCDRNVTKPAYRELSGKGSEAEQAAAAMQYARSWSNSWVGDIFSGLLQSTIECQACGHRSHCFDAFIDLSLPVPASHSCSVQDCLETFTVRETLDVEYKCEACKKCSPAVKWLRVYQPPRVLILHLKRFNQRSSASSAFGMLASMSSFGRLSKTSTNVDVPRTLDLSAFCNRHGLSASNNSGAYELIAISDHSGSLGGGHYTARGKAVSNGAWYCFNDSSVSSIPCPSGSSSSAYVLFYRLQGLPASCHV